MNLKEAQNIWQASSKVQSAWIERRQLGIDVMQSIKLRQVTNPIISATELDVFTFRMAISGILCTLISGVLLLRDVPELIWIHNLRLSEVLCTFYGF